VLGSYHGLPMLRTAAFIARCSPSENLSQQHTQHLGSPLASNKHGKQQNTYRRANAGVQPHHEGHVSSMTTGDNNGWLLLVRPPLEPH